MCGIAGLFNKHDIPADRELLEKMSSRLNRRGPDGEGYYTEGIFGLVHKRLSIIDLQGGVQPMFNEDRSIIFVHNGEIYNHHELRRELEAKGHKFQTHSDSECIGHLYEEYGMEFPAKLEGMFAIALVDQKRRKLVLVTDRAGKKPIFYYSGLSGFRFASTLSALAMDPEMPRDLDLQAVWDYMSFLSIPAPDTMYLGVSKMLPACIMSVSPDMEYPDSRIYWKPDYARKTEKDFARAAALLRDSLKQAVHRRLEADVPLGVFLSGGLDSTIIASIVSRLRSTEPMKCFTIGVNDSRYDESVVAERNAAYLKSKAGRPIEFHKKIVQPDDFELLRKLCREYGEPFADSSILPTHLLCQFARESVTVALSGDGADELFAGYERYRALNLLATFDGLPKFIRNPMLSFNRKFKTGAGERSFIGRFHRFLNVADAPPEYQYHVMISKCPYPLKKSLLGLAFSDFTPQQTRRFSTEMRTLSSAFGRVERAMEFDWHFYLPNDILTKMDTASMAASLEVRCPFLDREVVEIAAAMPLEFKLCGKQRKYILQEAFGGYVPVELATAKKKGFGIPMASWLRGPWKKHLQENLLEGVAINEYELFQHDTVEFMIEQHCQKKADFSYPLYLLLVFELTLQENLKE
ncbi:MAG: asparagine synthase (glutamine-hydrolyzing) [Lentisphaeria bacterium]|nr:asparagine synthase (glutamine-hydrolyzing) [Lentisphaeria bacterium]